MRIEELETYFHLQLTEDEEFFPEWRENLPAITDWQQQLLNQVKAGYENLIKQPPLLKKAVTMTVIYPLLFIGEFYLHPFALQAEKTVEITAQDREFNEIYFMTVSLHHANYSQPSHPSYQYGTKISENDMEFSRSRSY